MMVDERRACLDISSACKLIKLSKATYYRSKLAPKGNRNRFCPRKLSANERQEVLDVFHEERFVDMPAGQVYNRLLDEGKYLVSERTMYRILADNKLVKEKRQLRRHPKYARPELLAKGPNQLWSWDITRMRGPNKLEYYHLYVILDVYSRYIVGWMLADRESAELAKLLVSQSCKSQCIGRNQLNVHSDRGPSMKSKTLADLYAHLGVVKSFSRPRVSNDNPYSESQFKTMKYCPTYPDRFGSIEDARSFCHDFFSWYNNEHYHSGIKMLTPATVHKGEADKILQARAKTKVAAFKRHKERFVNGSPKTDKLEKEVWINAPEKEKGHNSTENPEVITLKAKKQGK